MSRSNRPQPAPARKAAFQPATRQQPARQTAPPAYRPHAAPGAAQPIPRLSLGLV
jgi:hypothetical protein